jgi:hypothetical protein
MATAVSPLVTFDTHPAAAQTGFDIGWDHARHGLLPPPAAWSDASPLQQGWQAGRACFAGRTLAASARVRRWLALRLHAWQRGRSFELAEVTPHYLGQIEVALCPVLRQPLAAAEASVDRVCDRAGYAAGNLAMMSAAANRAKGALGLERLLQRAEQARHAADGRVDGLDAAAWLRLATLVSFVTPLPHEQAVRLPMHLLPPNRLRLLNPVQGLQALVTRELGRPDGTRRLRVLSALLPDEGTRLDFHRFLAAMLPRCIEAGRAAEPWVLRHALEDAWSDARVQRCWQRFAGPLSAAQVEQLLQRCAAGALGAAHVLLHDLERATEGWALERGGRVPARAPRAAAPPLPGSAWADGARIAALRARTADGHLPV